MERSQRYVRRTPSGLVLSSLIAMQLKSFWGVNLILPGLDCPISIRKYRHIFSAERQYVLTCWGDCIHIIDRWRIGLLIYHALSLSVKIHAYRRLSRVKKKTSILASCCLRYFSLTFFVLLGQRPCGYQRNMFWNSCQLLHDN